MMYHDTITTAHSPAIFKYVTMTNANGSALMLMLIGYIWNGILFALDEQKVRCYSVHLNLNVLLRGI